MFAAERRKRPLVFVDDLSIPVISDRDERHLRSSLRLRDDSPITVGDGRGSYYFCRLGSIGSTNQEIRFEPAPVKRTAVGFSPIKAQKAEWLVSKLTELGVDTIQPVLADRCVVRWNKKKTAVLDERLQIAVREAAMQCKRVWLPTVAKACTVAELVQSWAATGDAPILRADPSGSELDSSESMVLVGPEGGWSEAEAALANAVSLPGNVLRAETAVIVAAAMLERVRYCE